MGNKFLFLSQFEVRHIAEHLRGRGSFRLPHKYLLNFEWFSAKIEPLKPAFRLMVGSCWASLMWPLVHCGELPLDVWHEVAILSQSGAKAWIQHD